MLTDAVDGALPAGDAVAFQAHHKNCLACAQLLEEATRGAEWLRFLDHEPEVPAGLAERILLHTTGPEAAAGGGDLPMLAPAGPALPEMQGWFGNYRLGSTLSLLYRHPAESRLLMTVAMAFFSIAFTMNLAGVRLKEFHLRDLRPSVLATSLSRGYYSASAHVMRYYENLRFVYELESRVNELRRSASDASTPETAAPKGPANGTQPSAPAPRQNAPGGGGAAKGTTPGKAPERRPAPGPGLAENPPRIIPVSIGLRPRSTDPEPAFWHTSTAQPPQADGRAFTCSPRTYLTHIRDQAERSLA